MDYHFMRKTIYQSCQMIMNELHEINGFSVRGRRGCLPTQKLKGRDPTNHTFGFRLTTNYQDIGEP